MTILAEARRYGRHNDDRELTPYTAGADEPNVTPEQIQGMMDKVFNLGWERRRQLDDYVAKKGASIQQFRNGDYYINSAHRGQYADFYEQANYDYLKEKYTWLHSVSEGLGFDEAKGEESHGEFETFLASIPHEEWMEFFSEMEQLEDYPILDGDRASELEMEEAGRWMTEDGGPELIEELIEATPDAYEGFLFTKITPDLIWEWSRDTEHYPEAQGQGDVWMNMEELAKERETQEWFLDHLEDDVAGWQAAKQEGYSVAAAGFDGLLRALAEKDDQLVHVYNQLDNASQFRLFLETFPDERRNADDPYWYFWKPHYNQPGAWRVGFQAERGPNYTPKWEPGYTQALEYLAEQPWFLKLYRETFRRTPEGHPELKLEDTELEPKYYLDKLDATQSLRVADTTSPEGEVIGVTERWWTVHDTHTDELVGWIAKPGWTPHNPNDWLGSVGNKTERCGSKAEALQWIAVNRENPRFGFNEAQELDPDDPAIYMTYGGGLREELVYEDDKIVVMYPRDVQTLNYHLRLSGLREIDKSAWHELFYNKEIFVVIGKEAPDMLGHSAERELGIIWGSDSGPLGIFTGTSLLTFGLDQLLANPDYGKNIRRMLIQHYRAQVKRGFTQCANILLQVGGVSELRRAHRHGDIHIENFGLPIGLHYIKRHQYGLAAKALKRSIKTIRAEGVWLIFDDVSDLSSCFKNDDTANTVFSHDTSDWFDYYYERQNRPEVKDVIPFLDARAIQHIREVMVNRRVWFPDGGPDQRGEYVVLTPKVLAEYDDDTILDWLANLSDEDKADEVFDDIIDAIQLAGVDILLATSQDTVHAGFVKAAVEAIDGTQHRWTTHPTKKYANGNKRDAFMVFVPWKSVFDWADTFMSNHEYAYDGDLESLAVQANEGTVEPDVTRFEAGWEDVNKDYAKEQLDRIYELKAPAPGPGMAGYEDPRQLPLPLKEGEDEDIAALKAQYGLAEPDYDIDTLEREADAQGHTQQVAKDAARRYLNRLKEGGELDDPDPSSAMFSGIPVELEKQVNAQLQEFSEMQGIPISDVRIEWKYRSGSTDELQISFQVEGVNEFDGPLWRWAMDPVRLAVIHAFKERHLLDSWFLDDLANQRIIMRFTLVEQVPEAPLPF